MQIKIGTSLKRKKKPEIQWHSDNIHTFKSIAKTRWKFFFFFYAKFRVKLVA